MRRPRLRFTILGLMVLVIMMAIGLGVWVEAMRSGRRAQFYRAKAEEMARAEQDHRNEAARHHNWVISNEVVIELQRERAQTDQDRRALEQALESLEFQKKGVRDEDLLADFYRDLALKYGRAADHPWEPVSPDPPFRKAMSRYRRPTRN